MSAERASRGEDLVDVEVDLRREMRLSRAAPRRSHPKWSAPVPPWSARRRRRALSELQEKRGAATLSSTVERLMTSWALCRERHKAHYAVPELMPPAGVDRTLAWVIDACDAA
jgi:hypothetical protein